MHERVIEFQNVCSKKYTDNAITQFYAGFTCICSLIHITVYFYFHKQTVTRRRGISKFREYVFVCLNVRNDFLKFCHISQKRILRRYRYNLNWYKNRRAMTGHIATFPGQSQARAPAFT